jgi:hypothetical protein
VNTGVSYGGFDVDRPGLRGGPALIISGNWNTWLSISTDDRKKLVIEPSASMGVYDQDYGNWHDVSLSVQYQITNALQMSFEPGYQFDNQYCMYVKTINVDNINNYLVASMMQKIVSANIRIDLSLTPDLTIQYWGQPFVFSGDYYQFKKVVDAGNYDVKDQFHVFTPNQISYDTETDTYSISENGDESLDYAFDNPDFSFFEFRSNFVVRWEYIPGSTAYLVWSQGRNGDTPQGDFSLSDHFNKLIDLDPTNIFLIKFSYRISM